MSQQMGSMGGPVGGGGAPQANAGTPSSSGGGNTIETHIKRLNTAIYDYLLRQNHFNLAREFMKVLDIEQSIVQKRSPNQRNGQQQPNGVGDGMDVDSKENALQNIPPDLPLPAEYLGGGPFLQDWWIQFWEIWNGQRRKASRPGTHDYIAQQRSAAKSRGANGMPIMNPNTMQNMRYMNGIPQDLRRGVLGVPQARMNPQQAAQQAKNMGAQQGQMVGGNPMERQGSAMENAGGSPSQGGDDPPSKRQRLDGNVQQMNQARPGQPTQMPGNPQGMPPGTMGPNGNQSSPVAMDPTKDMYAGANVNVNGRLMPANPGVPGQTGPTGNHALQDYQMQLMLLEQQNKKRLLMARQEHENMGPGMGPNGSPMTGMIDPNMRQQMMPQMGPNGQMRGPSSHPMANMTPQQQAEFMRQQGMLPNGAFPGGQMPPGMMPGQQPPPGGQPALGQPMGTPRQQNTAMPPPPAPQNNAGGTQPSSPSSQPAPPTPNQAGKQAKGKKNETKNSKKKNSAANATPASEPERPPTPPPATPMNPLNAAQNFNNQNKQLPNGQLAGGASNQPNNAGGPPSNNQQPPPAAAAAAAGGNQQPAGGQPGMQQQQQPDMSSAPFGDLGGADGFSGMDMPFGSLEGGDVLDNFDFDSFLNDSADGGLGFDANFAFGDGGIETGGLEGGN